MISMKISQKNKVARSVQATTASVFTFDDKVDDNAILFVEGDHCSSSEYTSGPSSPSFLADDFRALGCALAESGDEGDMRNALSHFDKGLLLDPTNHVLWELKSQVLLHFDRHLPAIRAADEAVRLAPGWAEGHLSLARAQREFGEIELALTSMRMAQSLDANNEDYALELAEIEAIVGQLLAARAQYAEEKRVMRSCCGGGHGGGETCLAGCVADDAAASTLLPPYPPVSTDR